MDLFTTLFWSFVFALFVVTPWIAVKGTIQDIISQDDKLVDETANRLSTLFQSGNDVTENDIEAILGQPTAVCVCAFELEYKLTGKIKVIASYDTETCKDGSSSYRRIRNGENGSLISCVTIIDSRTNRPTFRTFI